ncbi:MAG: hypothetical protein NUV51_10965 [Sulfuricaulis sp.]|nr:hypothetical protein [Sulfuricaulis sp.]
MRYRDNGAFYSVNISRREVEDFAERWPCFGARRAIWAQFDKRNGDLVDLSGDVGMDGGGVIALLQDAQESVRNPFREISLARDSVIV